MHKKFELYVLYNVQSIVLATLSIIDKINSILITP